jgi:hypothetical protein
MPDAEPKCLHTRGTDHPATGRTDRQVSAPSGTAWVPRAPTARGRDHVRTLEENGHDVRALDQEPALEGLEAVRHERRGQIVVANLRGAEVDLLLEARDRTP